ncbi:hypothetical protein [Spirosoma aerophilum]
MENTFDPHQWHNNLTFRWIALPVLAHLLSWMMGIIGIALFPILVTVAQYLIFTIHPAVSRPGAWFFTLPITFYVWTRWGPVVTYLQPGGILYGVIGYYAGQLINTLFIPLISKEGRPELLLNWLGCNIVTLLVWIVLLGVMTGSTESSSHATNALYQYVLLPAIALAANFTSSLFLLKE